MKAQKMVPLADYQRAIEKIRSLRAALKQVNRACALHKLRADRDEDQIAKDVLARLDRKPVEAQAEPPESRARPELVTRHA